jgi:hypothetical protein
MPANASALSVYLDYEYLAAQQLGGLLLGTHGVYDELFYADAPFWRQLPNAPAARLRIDTVETGNSVTVFLAQGITQLVGSADQPLVQVASSTAALTATGALILRFLHGWVNLRAKITRTSREHKLAQIEVADKGLDLAIKARDAGISLAEVERVERPRLAQVEAILSGQAPGRTPDQRAALARRLMPHLDAIALVLAEENIREVRITLPDPPAGPEG